MAKLTKEQLERRNARKEFFNADVMQFETTVKTAKGSDLPTLTNKQIFLYDRLLKNDIAKGYRYTLESLSNDYRKHVARVQTKDKKNKSEFTFRKSFKTSEVFNASDVKAVTKYAYFANERLFVFYRNEKGSYLIREDAFKPNLMTLKVE